MLNRAPKNPPSMLSFDSTSIQYAHEDNCMMLIKSTVPLTQKSWIANKNLIQARIRRMNQNYRWRECGSMNQVRKIGCRFYCVAHTIYTTLNMILINSSSMLKATVAGTSCQYCGERQTQCEVTRPRDGMRGVKKGGKLVSQGVFNVIH